MKVQGEFLFVVHNLLSGKVNNYHRFTFYIRNLQITTICGAIAKLQKFFAFVANKILSLFTIQINSTTKTNKTSVMRVCPSHDLIFYDNFNFQTKECSDAASKYHFFDLVPTTIRWYTIREKLVYSNFAKSTMEQSPAINNADDHLFLRFR